MTPDRRRELLSRPFALPGDVHIVPVGELAESVHGAIGAEEGEFAVSRPGYRVFSRIVDADTVALLEEFRRPTPIAEAIVRFARRRGLDPQEVLETAFPVLQNFSAAMLLVPADSPFMEAVEASFTPGQVVAGYEIRRLVQVMQDTELYLAAGPGAEPVALKLARQDAPRRVRRMLEREAAVLEHLAGICCPRLMESGAIGAQPFLATEWLAGIPIGTRALELRGGRAEGWRHGLHRLCERLIDCYRTLHGRQVVHGDVHPRNVLVDGEDRVVLLDFGYSTFTDPRSPHRHAQRPGLGWFMEPEAVAAIRRGVPPAAADPAGEQYALGALVYWVICGEHSIDAPPEQERFARRLLETPPAPFSRRGFESWPEVERVLSRALAKDPAARFASAAALLEAFRSARPPAAGRAPAVAAADAADHLLDTVIERAVGNPRPLEELFGEAPTASVAYGAAGLAWFLYRLALLRDSPPLLVGADLWSRRALGRLDHEDAFDSAAVGVAGERVGPGSLYHRAAGVHLVHALVCHARGDFNGLVEQVERFAVLAGRASDQVELAFGWGGVLIGAALLHDALRSTQRLDAAPVADLLGAAAERVWPPVTSPPAPGSGDRLPYLGMAHGWTGLIYARLRACRSLDAALPAGIQDRLDWLAGRAEPSGRGLCWEGTVQHAGQTGSAPDQAPGWCAGTAGHVHLWTLAHEALGEPRYLDLAEGAAWHSWEHPDRHGHLCCGLAGRVFALVRFYQHTGERAWLERARRLSELSGDWLAEELRTGRRPHSLYWGALGPLLAAVELEQPELAAMPVFAAEGWPSAGWPGERRGQDLARR